MTVTEAVVDLLAGGERWTVPNMALRLGHPCAAVLAALRTLLPAGKVRREPAPATSRSLYQYSGVRE